MLNRKAFFSEIRKTLFAHVLTQPQVDGINAILDEWERRKLTDDRWLAYMLATTYHETGTAMQPVIETRQPHEPVNPSVETAITRLEHAWAAGKMPWVKTAYWRKDAAGLSWLGRGLPQVTHKANYEWAERLTGIPFTRDPGLMLVMKNAVPVMFIGMIDGRFTGKKLADFFNTHTTDSFNARRIINATESAAKVQGYYDKIKTALTTARAIAPASSVPQPPDVPPVQKPPAGKPAGSPVSMAAGILGIIVAAWATLMDHPIIAVLAGAIVILGLLTWRLKRKDF